jgi:ABC-2 type transport system permease protein
MPPSAERATGAIYDIGYRSYDGPRLGRGYAFRTLYVQSLRTAFGLGRGTRALVVPWALFAIIVFPAAVTVMAAAMTGGMAQLLSYPQYFPFVSMNVALLCAAQAPELVSTDQHSGVLPLYFSRPLRRLDYALARLAGMATIVYLLVLTPLVIILLGRISLGTDFRAAVRAEAPSFLPILATPLVAAMALGTLSLALASLTSRRGIGAALFLGLVLVTTPLSAILASALEGRGGEWGLMLNPVFAAQGTISWLFGVESSQGALGRAAAELPSWSFPTAIAAYAVLSTALLLGRYARMRT